MWGKQKWQGGNKRWHLSIDIGNTEKDYKITWYIITLANRFENQVNWTVSENRAPIGCSIEYIIGYRDKSRFSGLVRNLGASW